jgi:hypothetical protein
MIRLRSCAIASFLLLAAAGAAATPFQAFLDVRLGNLGSVSFTGSGTGTSSPQLVTIPAGVFAGTVSVPLMAAPPVTALRVQLAGNVAGGWSGAPPGGPLAVEGAALVRGNLGGGPTTLVAIPLFETRHAAGSAVSSVGFGIGGTIYRTGAYAPSAYLRVYNQPWTAGVAAVSMLPTYYFYHLPFGAAASQGFTYTYSTTKLYSGSDSRTPGGFGQLTLVSPTRVVSTLTGPRFVLVTLGTLTLSFAPEPGTALLLGAGMALLAALPALRRRS